MTRTWRLAGLMCCLSGGLAPLYATQAQDAPEPLTTDTKEYCMHLLDQVSAMVRAAPTTPPEVTSLSTEGERMCVHGQPRNGVQRLRRAIVLMRAGGAAP